MIVAAATGSLELHGEERARQAGIGTGRLELCVSARVIGTERRVDDELDRFRAEPGYRGNDFVGQFS